jgi:hypothetical protein
MVEEYGLLSCNIVQFGDVSEEQEHDSSFCCYLTYVILRS